MLSVALFAVLMTAQAKPIEDCTVGEAFPLLSTSKWMQRDDKDHGLTEGARIGKDIELTVVSGGCVHYGATLTFTLPSSTRRKQPLLTEAAGLMSKAHLKPSMVADIIPRLRARAKADYVSGDDIYDPAHEMETIVVSEEIANGHRRIIVFYRFIP